MSTHSSSSHTGDKGEEGEQYPDYFDCVAKRWNLWGIGGGWFYTNMYFLDSYIKRTPSMCRVLSELYQECVESKGPKHDVCNFFKYKSSFCLSHMDESSKKFKRALAAEYASKFDRSYDCEYIYNRYKECVCRGKDWLFGCPEVSIYPGCFK